jgi:hypothetical protein
MRCAGLVADWATSMEEVHTRIAGAFARASRGLGLTYVPAVILAIMLEYVHR